MLAMVSPTSVGLWRWFFWLVVSPQFRVLVIGQPASMAGVMEEQHLLPSEPLHMRVGIGQAKFVKFTCMGGPADIVISLSTYQQRADPFLFLSLDPSKAPTFQKHDASSLGLWRENHVGNHYVIAKGVNPKGGILGVANMPHFAAEELNGNVDIRCIFIIAFDTLFWDHLRMESVCPVGAHVQQDGRPTQAYNFCSGHGTCAKHGVCQCDGDFAGAACEHSKTDVVVAADGHYSFKVATGRYQYFRIRIPPRFPGGFLNVKVMASEQPLVVLVKGNDVPTKTEFELSNFADWLRGNYISVLKFPVLPSGAQHAEALSMNGTGRLFGLQCPTHPPQLFGATCSSQPYNDCKASCARCMICTKGINNGAGDRGCSQACDSCTSPRCINTLAQCAANVECNGPNAGDAIRCEQTCGQCMACFDSNDEGCKGCHCCLSCLPVAAKCSKNEGIEYNRFAYVGVYNHQRSAGDRQIVNAVADVQLSADPSYMQEDSAPMDWIQDLYDSFHDVRAFQVTQQEVYPDGEMFIFEQNFSDVIPILSMQIQIYNQRATLLRLGGLDPQADEIVMQRTDGPRIGHILSSVQVAPKTFFDFDQLHEMKDEIVEVDTRHAPVVWVAFFGDEDGQLLMTLTTKEAIPQAPAIGFALVCVSALLCSLVVLGVIYGGSHKIGEFLGMDQEVSLLERLGCLIRYQTPHESTVGLTRHTSLSGYIGSDVIDRSVEDQYLHRGGSGDDGI